MLATHHLFEALRLRHRLPSPVCVRVRGFHPQVLASAVVLQWLLGSGSSAGRKGRCGLIGPMEGDGTMWAMEVTSAPRGTKNGSETEWLSGPGTIRPRVLGHLLELTLSPRLGHGRVSYEPGVFGRFLLAERP